MRTLRSFASTLFVASLIFCTLASAQDAVLPDAPSSSLVADPDQQSAAQQPGGAQSVHEDHQQKRIFGILPNFRAVDPGVTLPPQTVRNKLVTATQDSFDYSAFLLTFVVAAYGLGTNQTPEFGSGGLGYARYLWHTYADQTSENLLVEFIVPALTHEDTRYYAMGKGGFPKRLGYALTRSFITRTDSGGRTFNAGEIIGSGASAGLSNFYYPGPERTFGNTADKWGTSIGIDTVSFVLKEFSPDIYHVAFHHKQAGSPSTP